MKLSTLTSRPVSINRWLSITALLALLLLPAFALADVNVLIIGSARDSSYAISGITVAPFWNTAIRTELQNILNGANLGNVNVQMLDRNADAQNSAYSLANWFHYPYPAFSAYSPRRRTKPALMRCASAIRSTSGTSRGWPRAVTTSC